MAMTGLMGVMKLDVIPMRIQQVMEADTNKDGKLSREEWISAAETNSKDSIFFHAFSFF